MFIYNLRLSKRNLSIVVQSNRLLTYFKLTYLHFMNKENDVQKPGNFIYVQCTYLSYSNHKRKKFSTTNVSNMWMIHYFSKLMWPLETLQRNTMALPVTSSSKWKIFSNFLAFSEYPNLKMANLENWSCPILLRKLTRNGKSLQVDYYQNVSLVHTFIHKIWQIFLHSRM